MTNYIFVYGTLKEGGWNHHLLNGCEFIGHGKARGCVLLRLGPIPGLVPGRVPGEQHANDAIGEVYKIPDGKLPYLLNRLDSLENNEELYVRAMVTTDALSGPWRTLECITYLYMLNLNSDAVVEGGNWPIMKCQAAHGPDG